MSDQTNPIKVGIIGFGFMGRAHAKAYQDAQADGYPVSLAAIADRGIHTKVLSPHAGNIEANQEDIDTAGIELLEDAKAVIEHPDLDLVSICTHTDSHVDLAIAALQAGKHVLVEKPIALRPDDVQRLADAASQTDRLCIPAMCMRHWPAWAKIHEMIKSNTHGPVRSAVFHRLGSRPVWGGKFYSDDSRTGGVLHDLHIHDTDFIIHCFDRPDSVTTTGDPLRVTTIYNYPHIPNVTAQGAWDNPPSLGFQIKCTITFEGAALDFDLNRDQQLMLHRGDESTHIETSPLTGYDQEVRFVIDQIRSKSTCKPMGEAVLVANVLDAEQRSMASKKPISLR